MSMNVTAPPSMRRLATEIREVGALPFKTENDLLRWCFFAGLGQLIKLVHDKAVTAEYRNLASIVRITSDLEKNRTYREVLAGAEKELAKLMEEGHETKALMLAEEVWKACDSIQDQYWCRYWRKTAKAMLDKVKE